MSANGDEFDVIVVGGGPGGSTVGSFVAKQGHRVLLLERERFPRYSIGESLLPVTVNGICKLLGVRDKIDNANFMRKYGGTWRWGREQALWSFAFEENEQLHLEKFDYAYQVERSRFDEILLRHAQELGVDVREEHAVTGVVHEDGRVAGVRYTEASGVEKTARARFVVDASGHQSSLHRAAGTRVLSKFFRNVALFTYFENAGRRPAPRQGDILCAAFDAGWFWFIPLSPTLTSVGVVIAPEHASQLQRDHDEVMRDFVSRCPVIADLLAPATRVTEGVYGKYRVRSDYSYSNTKFFAPGLALVGDAACFVDPVFSTGVHLATYSALLAARSINTCLEGSIDEARCFEEFEHRYRAEFNNIFGFLLVIYDMNHDKDSYFWNARKIVNTEEVANQAFVRLVAGMSTTGDEFFSKRRHASEVMAPRLQRHFYNEPAERPKAPAQTDPELRQILAEGQRQRDVIVSERTAMVHSSPFPDTPVRPNGLVPSEDGLSWRESVLAAAAAR